jgi:hypothetical protein
MYPAFTSKRPRLPSIMTVFQPIEQYRADLEKRGPFRASAAAALEPLDAYLTHLFVSGHPGEPVFIDLTAEATAGASTLLALSHPRVSRVLAAGGPLPGDRRAYRGAVEDFLHRQGKTLSCLEWLPRAEPTPELDGMTDAILFLDAGQPALDAEVERWLNCMPAAIVLVFGLGAVGDCAAIDALLQRFPSASRRRFALLRDCGEVLSASRLGMVAERNNSSADVALARLRHWFTGNYSFLGLLRSATEQAIRSASIDGEVLKNHGLFGEWNNEINRLKWTAQQTRDIAAAREAELLGRQRALEEELFTLAEELFTLRRSLSYRIGGRLRRLRSQLAPELSWRYRLYYLVRRAAQIGRKEGMRGLLRRLARRYLGRQA